MSNVGYLIYERKVRDMLGVVGQLDDETRAGIRQGYDSEFPDHLCADMIKLEWLQRAADSSSAGQE